MAAKTFLELQTDALRQIDELTGGNSATVRTIIKAGINESYSEAAGIRDWKTLENNTTVTTSSGTMEYTPVNSSASTPRIRRIESIIDQTANRYLNEVKREDFERDYPYVDTSNSQNLGAPTYWFQSGYDSNRDIKFKTFLVPNDTRTLQVNFIEEPVELSNDDDEPRIPDQYHYGLTYKPIAKYFEYQEYYDKAAYYLQLHENWKRVMLDAEYGDSDEMPEMKPQTHNRGFVQGKIGRVYN